MRSPAFPAVSNLSAMALSDKKQSVPLVRRTCRPNIYERETQGLLTSTVLPTVGYFCMWTYDKLRDRLWMLPSLFD